MEYPLLIDGERSGSLTVSVDGLFTVFEAAAGPQDALVRISVYGGGEEGYLGVMQPWSGGLYLRRRFSRGEMRRMPSVIEYAAPAGMCGPVTGSNGKDMPTDERSDPDGAQSPCRTASAPAPEALPASCPDELLWFARPDGTLTAFDGKSSIVALPAALRREAPGAVLRMINGRIYMLFRY